MEENKEQSGCVSASLKRREMEKVASITTLSSLLSRPNTGGPEGLVNPQCLWLIFTGCACAC